MQDTITVIEYGSNQTFIVLVHNIVYFSPEEFGDTIVTVITFANKETKTVLQSIAQIEQAIRS